MLAQIEVQAILEGVPDQKRQFMSVLHTRWNSHSTAPVEVVEALRVRQLPEGFFRIISAVF
jgi:hypothetical protein